MKNSTDLSLINESESSSSRICINEILIGNDSYIVSMCLNNCQPSQIDIKVRAKQTADQWKSTFNVHGHDFILFIALLNFIYVNRY